MFADCGCPERALFCHLMAVSTLLPRTYLDSLLDGCPTPSSCTPTSSSSTATIAASTTQATLDTSPPNMCQSTECNTLDRIAVIERAFVSIQLPPVWGSDLMERDTRPYSARTTRAATLSWPTSMNCSSTSKSNMLPSRRLEESRRNEGRAAHASAPRHCSRSVCLRHPSPQAARLPPPHPPQRRHARSPLRRPPPYSPSSPPLSRRMTSTHSRCRCSARRMRRATSSTTSH